MSTTIEQWEVCWKRLCDAREKLQGCRSPLEVVKSNLSKQPGEVPDTDYGVREPPPAPEVKRAIEEFANALIAEGGAFRMLAKADQDAVGAQRNFA